MIEFFRTRLPSLPDSSLRLALALAAMPAAGAKVTRQELCHRAGIASSLLDRALQDAEFDKILVLKTRSGTEYIIVTSDLDGTERKITLLPDVPLESEVQQLREEKLSLIARIRHRAEDDSGLANEIPLEEGSAVRLAESLVGRALSITEAYRLGQMIQGYGPARVKGALEIKKKSANPLRASYAFLANGARGSAAAQKEAPKPVAYFTPSDDYHPF